MSNFCTDIEKNLSSFAPGCSSINLSDKSGIDPNSITIDQCNKCITDTYNPKFLQFSKDSNNFNDNMLINVYSSLEKGGWWTYTAMDINSIGISYDTDDSISTTPAPTPAPTSTTAPTPAPKYKCRYGKCVPHADGGTKEDCEDMCKPLPRYSCKNYMCVPDGSGGQFPTIDECNIKCSYNSPYLNKRNTWFSSTNYLLLGLCNKLKIHKDKQNILNIYNDNDDYPLIKQFNQSWKEFLQNMYFYTNSSNNFIQNKKLNICSLINYRKVTKSISLVDANNGFKEYYTDVTNDFVSSTNNLYNRFTNGWSSGNLFCSPLEICKLLQKYLNPNNINLPEDFINRYILFSNDSYVFDNLLNDPFYNSTTAYSAGWMNMSHKIKCDDSSFLCGSDQIPPGIDGGQPLPFRVVIPGVTDQIDVKNDWIGHIDFGYASVSICFGGVIKTSENIALAVSFSLIFNCNNTDYNTIQNGYNICRWLEEYISYNYLSEINNIESLLKDTVKTNLENTNARNKLRPELKFGFGIIINNNDDNNNTILSNQCQFEYESSSSLKIINNVDVIYPWGNCGTKALTALESIYMVCLNDTDKTINSDIYDNTKGWIYTADQLWDELSNTRIHDCIKDSKAYDIDLSKNIVTYSDMLSKPIVTNDKNSLFYITSISIKNLIYMSSYLTDFTQYEITKNESEPDLYNSTPYSLSIDPRYYSVVYDGTSPTETVVQYGLVDQIFSYLNYELSKYVSSGATVSTLDITPLMWLNCAYWYIESNLVKAFNCYNSVDKEYIPNGFSKGICYPSDSQFPFAGAYTYNYFECNKICPPISPTPAPPPSPAPSVPPTPAPTPCSPIPNIPPENQPLCSDLQQNALPGYPICDCGNGQKCICPCKKISNIVNGEKEACDNCKCKCIFCQEDVPSGCLFPDGTKTCSDTSNNRYFGFACAQSDTPASTCKLGTGGITFDECNQICRPNNGGGNMIYKCINDTCVKNDNIGTISAVDDTIALARCKETCGYYYCKDDTGKPSLPPSEEERFFNYGTCTKLPVDKTTGTTDFSILVDPSSQAMRKESCDLQCVNRSYTTTDPALAGIKN